MTREEIKNVVCHVFHFYEVNAENCNWADMNEACGEIFKALEQEPCEDAISREDALMALTGEWTVSKDELIAKFVRRIKKLQSVIPKDDRQELIDRIRKLQKYRFSKDDDAMVNLDDVIAILEGGEPE